jgi:hypothetical protein
MCYWYKENTKPDPTDRIGLSIKEDDVGNDGKETDIEHDFKNQFNMLLLHSLSALG